MNKQFLILDLPPIRLIMETLCWTFDEIIQHQHTFCEKVSFIFYMFKILLKNKCKISLNRS